MGKLYVVATPIGNLRDMTPRAIETLRAVQLIAAEDTRHSARLMREFEIQTPMISYHQHNRRARADRLGQALAEGDVALISDAGTPGVADPGHELIADAIRAGHTVVPIPGASSMLAAVSGSGIVPGPFVFAGFLPRSGDDRRVGLARVLGSALPIVLFESPLRVAGTMRELATLDGRRQCVVARELTKVHEEFRRGTIAELAEYYERLQSAPRGEFVIVVGGAEREDEDGAGDDVDELALSLVRGGMKPSKAARELSSITGIPAAEAYDIVTRVGREHPGS